MKKKVKIFLLLILIEIISLLLVALLSGNNCSYPTPCDVPTFFNPFGQYEGICIQMITIPMQCNLSLIYLFEYVIILTALIFFIMHIICYKKK